MITDFDLALIFAVVLGTAILSKVTQLPITALEIVAGIALANLLFFQLPTSVAGLVTLGSLLIVFLAGFETNLDFLRQHLRPALLVGLPGFFAPFAGLLVVFVYLFHAPWLVAVLGAAALADTSISITYTTLHQYELAGLPFGRLVLAATLAINLMEDATVTGTTFLTGPAVALAFGLLIALFAAALTLPRLSNWIDRRYSSSFSNITTRALLLSLAILAGLSTLVRVPGILFVFMMGLLFSRYNGNAFLDDIRKFAFALFVPFYFLAVGLKVDFLFVIGNLAALGLIVGLGSLFKVGALFPAARRAFGATRAPAVATLMNTRLTSATVILLLSLNLGYLPESWYSLFISAVVILALGSTLVLRSMKPFASPESAKAILGSLPAFPGQSRPPQPLAPGIDAAPTTVR